MALILVRNPCLHDSRVLREAATLRELGYRPRIVAVVSDEVTQRRASLDGTPILRLAPVSPLSRIPLRLRRPEGASSPRRPRTACPELASRRPIGRGGALRRMVLGLHRWLRTLDFYRRAIHEVRKQRPALLHCNDYNTMWAGVAARVMGGIGVVYDAHELWPDRNQRPEPRWWLLACEWLFVRCAHRTLTASPGYAEVIARRYRVTPPTVVRNIPTPSRGGRSVGEASASGPVTYVGALTSNRGLEVAIAAVARLPRALLRLVGPVHDPYRDHLLETARRQGVLERLELAGSVPPSEVVEAIRDASVGLALIQPSCLSYELSLPNKLFEYVQAGVPVLASDLPVIGALVRSHGIGLVAVPSEPAEIADKLHEILQPERNRSLRRAITRAQAALRWEDESRLLRESYVRAARRLR